MPTKSPSFTRERNWTVALSALESDSVEIGEMALPLFESEMIVTFLTAHSSHPLRNAFARNFKAIDGIALNVISVRREGTYLAGGWY